MVKLARNCLGNKKTIYDGQNNEIKWQFIEDLVSLQISNIVNFGNKLTKSHIGYESNKMNVRLAAQTLSISTAVSMEYLCAEKVENFLKSEGTSQYCRIFNNSFDIMNTKPKHLDENFPTTINQSELEMLANFDFENKIDHENSQLAMVIKKKIF